MRIATVVIAAWLAATFFARADTGDYRSTPDVRALQAYGAQSPSILHADVASYNAGQEGGGHKFDWQAPSTANRNCTPNDVTVFSADGVDASTGCWVWPDPGTLTPEDAGAVHDGKTDDTSAFQRLAAVGGTVHLPASPACYRIAGTILLAIPQHWYGDGATASCVHYVPGLRGGVLFAVKAAGVEIGGFRIDASSETYMPATGNTYAVFITGSAAGSPGVHIHDMAFDDLSFSDALLDNGLAPGRDNLIVTHAIYATNADGLTVDGNSFRAISGAAVLLKGGSKIAIEHNSFKDVRWYNINAHSGGNGIEIAYNNFDDTGMCPLGVIWGGMIDVQSVTAAEGGGAPAASVYVHDNTLQGCAGYGAVERYQSVHGLKVEREKIFNVEPGTWVGPPSGLIGIVVNVRGTSLQDENGPPQDIAIDDNTISAPTNPGSRGSICVEVFNSLQAQPNPIRNVEIARNHCLAAGSAAWSNVVAVHGCSGCNGGGIESLTIRDNEGETAIGANPVLPGAIALISGSSGAAVKGVTIGGNVLADQGMAALSSQSCIVLGQFVDDVTFQKGSCKNFYFGLYVAKNAGSDIAGAATLEFTGTAARNGNIVMANSRPAPAASDTKPR